MVVIALGVDALDPGLVNPDVHPNLVLNIHRSIETIESVTGEPSTHELWPTIISGLHPDEHGLTIEKDGVAWGNPILNIGGALADIFVPDTVQTRIGAWMLTNTNADAFQTPATYYEDNNISTIFDDCKSMAIGIPNYVVNTDIEDREHALRRSLGDLFERKQNETGGHTSSDPYMFYERCMEMVMVRIARVRRGLRSKRHEMVFGYTSGLDLIGHVSYDLPELQQAAYDELNELIGELLEDLSDKDELLLVSDHGLQNGMHTSKAMVAGTSPRMVSDIESVIDVYSAINSELTRQNHRPVEKEITRPLTNNDNVTQQLKNLGYM